MNLRQLTMLLCCIGFFSTLNAQDAMPKSRLNVLKTNILSPLSISYERGLGKHFSLVASGLFFPSFVYGTPTGDLGYVSLADPSSGFSVEVRNYTSKTKAPLNGFYWGGYYMFRIADVIAHKITTSATGTSSLRLTIPSDLTTYGLMIGKQKIRSSGFTTDFSFGIGYYSFGNIPSISNESSDGYKLLSQLTKYKSGIGPRITFSLGYAF